MACLDRLREVAPGVYMTLLFLHDGEIKSDKLEDILTPKVIEYLEGLGTPPKIIEHLIADIANEPDTKNTDMPEKGLGMA